MSFPVLLFPFLDIFSSQSDPHFVFITKDTQFHFAIILLSILPFQAPARHHPISLQYLSVYESNLHDGSVKALNSSRSQHHPVTIALHAEILYASLDTVPTYCCEAPATLPPPACHEIPDLVKLLFQGLQVKENLWCGFIHHGNISQQLNPRHDAIAGAAFS